jgi:F0F1-type ATP synthase membrane subunit b/b'
MANIIALLLCLPILYVLPQVSVLRDLGVNETAPLMAVFFGISYFFISQFIVKPYQINLAYRKKNTGGSLAEANAINAGTEKLIAEYQEKLKKQNDTSQSVYEKIKSEGLSEEEKIISAARKQGADLVEQTKKQIASEVAVGKESLRAQIPELSDLIASRVLGRKIS